MISGGTLREVGRGLLAVACGLVLVFQLMASAMAASSHLATKFDAGEISLIEICGTTPESKRAPTTHVEGVNTCCVWTKSVALAPLIPPPSVSTVPEPAAPAAVTFGWRALPITAAGPKGPPKATGPPLHG